LATDFFARRTLGRFLDVLLELGPVVKAVLARDHELRVCERNVGLVRQQRAHAQRGIVTAFLVGAEQLFRLLLLLLEVRTGWEFPAEICGHDGLLR